MKTRNGFVSNSSSSSFVIKGNCTTAQVATSMMYEIMADRIHWSESWGKEEAWLDEQKQALYWLHNNLDFNENILIPWSTNYETFIWRDKGTIFVATCNNHDWSAVGPEYDHEVFKSQDVHYEDYFYEEPRRRDFLDLRDMKYKDKGKHRQEEQARWEEARKARENNEN